MTHHTPSEEAHPFPRPRIFIAPVSALDPIVPPPGLNSTPLHGDEARMMEQMKDWIDYKDSSDPQWLMTDTRLGPLLSTLRFMAEGPGFSALSHVRHRTYVELLRQKLGEDQVMELSQPWTPDQVWLLFQGLDQNKGQSVAGQRALLSVRLARRILGPWVKIAPFTVSDSGCFVSCWQTVFGQILPLLLGTKGQDWKCNRLPAGAGAGAGAGQPELWDLPHCCFSQKPDVRILYGIGTPAMGHSLLALDSWLPPAEAARCWVPSSTFTFGGACPLNWSSLGLPDFSQTMWTNMLSAEVCRRLLEENTQLKQEIEAERAARLQLEQREASRMEELSGLELPRLGDDSL